MLGAGDAERRDGAKVPVGGRKTACALRRRGEDDAHVFRPRRRSAVHDETASLIGQPKEGEEGDPREIWEKVRSLAVEKAICMRGVGDCRLV